MNNNTNDTKIEHQFHGSKMQALYINMADHNQRKIYKTFNTALIDMLTKNNVGNKK